MLAIVAGGGAHSRQQKALRSIRSSEIPLVSTKKRHKDIPIRVREKLNRGGTVIWVCRSRGGLAAGSCGV